MERKRIYNKFLTRCVRCEEYIPPGTPVVWFPEYKKVVHIECAAEQGDDDE